MKGGSDLRCGVFSDHTRLLNGSSFTFQGGTEGGRRLGEAGEGRGGRAGGSGGRYGLEIAERGGYDS